MCSRRADRRPALVAAALLAGLLAGRGAAQDRCDRTGATAIHRPAVSWRPERACSRAFPAAAPAGQSTGTPSALFSASARHGHRRTRGCQPGCAGWRGCPTRHSAGNRASLSADCRIGHRRWRPREGGIAVPTVAAAGPVRQPVAGSVHSDDATFTTGLTIAALVEFRQFFSGSELPAAELPAAIKTSTVRAGGRRCSPVPICRRGGSPASGRDFADTPRR